MTHHTSHYEFLVDLISVAMCHARLAQAVVSDTVIPLLPPQRRGIAEEVRRSLNGEKFISEAFLRDVCALISFLAREVEKGTQCDWVADEHDVHGGQHVRRFDDGAFALSNACDDLVSLHDAIADVLDFKKAGRIAEALIDT
ncbi:MAG: hypothetical protein V7786_07975 [Sulfitobacter litoralis]|jgi:hypothetical protein|uniref:hypothetical protein n=1 Tax=Sulfitobacter litoralis TaxID=335975 RepID=UPI00300260B0|tara:strand:- start:4780 stop:5205 length:426 start_codon:yes stop_codon:yes gene_type:complete